MIDTSSFNPQILPTKQALKDHNKRAKSAVVIAVIAAIVGLLYWWIMQNKQFVFTPAPMETAAERDARIQAQQLNSLITGNNQQLRTDDLKAREAEIKSLSTKPKPLSAEEAQIREQQIKSLSAQ